jgi:dihydrodipicolinate synthase/N-acetylneuraminate lyase
MLMRYRIVVAPAYYAFVYGKDKNALKEFFTSIADESPLPLLIYNVNQSKASGPQTDFPDSIRCRRDRP